VLGSYGGYENLKMLVISINLSTFKIYKNGPSIMNTRSNTTSILYVCTTIFKNYNIILSINILITEKPLVLISNKVHQHLKKNYPPNVW